MGWWQALGSTDEVGDTGATSGSRTMRDIDVRHAGTRFAALVWTLAQRDLKARYKGTLLGWLWSLIVPLARMYCLSNSPSRSAACA